MKLVLYPQLGHSLLFWLALGVSPPPTPLNRTRLPQFGQWWNGLVWDLFTAMSTPQLGHLMTRSKAFNPLAYPMTPRMTPPTNAPMNPPSSPAVRTSIWRFEKLDGFEDGIDIGSLSVNDSLLKEPGQNGISCGLWNHAGT